MSPLVRITHRVMDLLKGWLKPLRNYQAHHLMCTWHSSVTDPHHCHGVA